MMIHAVIIVAQTYDDAYDDDNPSSKLKMIQKDAVEPSEPSYGPLWP
jgi:hypothetical protein